MCQGPVAGERPNTSEQSDWRLEWEEVNWKDETRHFVKQGG